MTTLKEAITDYLAYCEYRNCVHLTRITLIWTMEKFLSWEKERRNVYYPLSSMNIYRIPIDSVVYVLYNLREEKIKTAER